MKVHRLDDDSRVCPLDSVDGKGWVLKGADARCVDPGDLLDFGTEKYIVDSVTRRGEFVHAVLTQRA